MASVSVIIVSYNTGPILARCLESVLMQENLHEIILLNNGNSEEVLARLNALAEKEAKLSIVTGHGNIGFAKACNLGASKATGDMVLLLNPDCLLPRGALKRASEALESHPDAWLAGCHMMAQNHVLQASSTRNLLTPRVAVAQAFQLFRFNKAWLPALNLGGEKGASKPMYVPAISGAFMLMKRDKYLEIGGLDEGYFFHVEDLDLCLQINRLGGKVLYLPDVKVVHYHSTSKVSDVFIERHKTRGFVRYFRKNFFNLKPRWLYVPLFYLVVAGVYARFFVRLLPMTIRKSLTKAASTGVHQGRHARQLALLNRRQQVPPALREKDFSRFEPVLVTGSTSQVGLCVIAKLLALNIKTVALYHSETVDYSHPQLRWVQDDFLSGSLDLDNVRPKTVIHTPPVWMLTPHLRQLHELGVKRIIAFSTTSIIGKAKSESLYEQEIVKKYLQAEQTLAEQCTSLGMQWTIFRPTMIYGVGLDKNITSIVNFIHKFGFFPVYHPGKGLRQPVHADDLATAVLNVLDTPSTYSKSYALAGSDKLSYLDMVRKIFFVMGRRDQAVTTRLLPMLLNAFSIFSGRDDINGEIAKRMNSDLIFDDSMARKDFGYDPRKFLQAGLADLGLEKSEFQIKR